MPLRLQELIRETALHEELEALRALHELATNWDEIKPLVRNIGDINDVLALLKAISDRNTQIMQTLNGLDSVDVSTAALESVARFLDRMQDVDPSLRKLTSKVGRFAETGTADPGLLDLPLLSVDKSRTATSAMGGIGLDFSISGAASFALQAEAGDLLPYPEAPSPGEHLRIGAEGSVMAGAGARIPFSRGAFGLGVEGQAAAGLDYYFQPDPDALYAFELFNHLPNLTNPFRYSSLVAAMRDERLEALELSTNGTLGGKLNLSVSQPGVLWAPRLPGQLKFSFAAEVRKTGAMDLVLRAVRDDQGNLNFARMTLSRSTTKDQATRTSLEVTVDSSGLFHGLRNNLGKLLGEYQDLMKDYKEFLEPGTWLRKKGKAWAAEALDGAISNNAIRDAVEMAFGSENARERFTSSLQGILTDAANSVTGFFDRETNQVKARLKAKVETNLPGFLVEALGPRLDRLIDSGVREIRERLATRTNGIARRAGEKADQHIEQLSRIGGRIGNAMDDAQGKADKLFEGVREALSDIERKLQELHDHAARLAREKLTVSWAETTTSSTGQRIEFDATLPVDTDLKLFDDMYEQFMRGDINKVAELLDHDEVTVHASALEAFANWQRKQEYTVIFMHLLLRKVSILDARALIRKEGENVAIGTKGSLQKWSESRQQKQTASFMNAIDLAAARSRPDDVRRHFQFRLGLKHEENRFREIEARNFLRAFEEIGAIAKGAADRAVAAMLDERLIGPNGVGRKTTIGLGMRLDDDGLSALLRLDNPANDQIEERLDLYKVCIPNLILSGSFDQRFHGEDRRGKRIEYANQVLDVLANRIHYRGDDKIQLLIDYNARKKLVAPGVTHLAGRQNDQLKRGEEIVEMLDSLYNTIVCLRNIWTTNPVQENRQEQWYRAQQKKIVDGLDKWMETGFALFGGWKDGKPQHETVAFCAIMGDLAGGATNPVMMNITIETEGRDEVIIID